VASFCARIHGREINRRRENTSLFVYMKKILKFVETEDIFEIFIAPKFHIIFNQILWSSGASEAIGSKRVHLLAVFLLFVAQSYELTRLLALLVFQTTF
jgi:hypothetical protein